VTAGPLPCEEARALLDEGFDRPLAPGEEEALRGHLAACAACREDASAAERIHLALASMTAPDPGPSFSDRVVAALDRAPGADGARAPSGADGPGLLRGLVAAAGTAAVAALAVAVLPLDAAAASVEGLLPRVPVPSLPELPAGAGRLLAGLPDLLPPWAAALAGLVAAAAVPVTALRRTGRRP
jgi:hypothetical protein